MGWVQNLPMQPSYHTTSKGLKLAYCHESQPNAAASVLFLPGFRSDMQGAKAQAVKAYCAQHGLSFTSLDYYAHGQSEGDFLTFTISKALQDIEELLSLLPDGPHIVIGSSMGGCLMVQLALSHPEKVAGLIGIAAAPDFTEKLMFERFSTEQRAEFEAEDVVYLPSEYSLEGYAITGHLIRDGRDYLVLDDAINIDKPVHLLHGMVDADVPYQFSTKLAEQLLSSQVITSLVKDGDHRLSRPQDIALLLHALAGMHGGIQQEQQAA